MQRIFFRADAGPDIGYGHFIRTLALADMLKDHFECTYYTQKPTVYQKKEVSDVCKLVSLPADDSRFDLFLEDLAGDEIVVLDNYFYTTDYQLKIKAKGCKLVCIDDMHDKHYVADGIINHILTDMSLFDCEPYTKFCLGLDYALLRPSFRKATSQKPRNNNLVVNFGGADSCRITDKVVSLLLKLNVSYNIIVILGDKVQLNEENRRCVTVQKNLTSEQMSRLFDESAAGILSASTVSIEAVSRQMPVILGYYIDNQEDYCRKLSEDGMAISIEKLQDIDEEKLAISLQQLKSFKPKPFNSQLIKSRYVEFFKSLSYDA